MNEISKCPMHAVPANVTFAARSNRDWWPNQLNLKLLQQNPPAADPMGEEFDYAEEVASTIGSDQAGEPVIRTVSFGAAG